MKPDFGHEVEDKYERSGSFSSVGHSTVEAIAIRYNKDLFLRLLPVPRLLDFDQCMLLFYLNNNLAQKVRSITVYGNEYKLSEIEFHDISVEQPHKTPEVPLLFSEKELSDPWVIIRPKGASFFKLRFSEQTPRRFYFAEEVSERRPRD